MTDDKLTAMPQRSPDDPLSIGTGSAAFATGIDINIDINAVGE